MTTTIQVSDDIRKQLEKMKLYERESLNEVIERMIEDNMELSDKTKQEVEEARKRVKSGRFITHEEVKRRLGI
jgi:predicted transcriptional regulator